MYILIKIKVKKWKNKKIVIFELCYSKWLCDCATHPSIDRNLGLKTSQILRNTLYLIHNMNTSHLFYGKVVLG